MPFQMAGEKSIGLEEIKNESVDLVFFSLCTLVLMEIMRVGVGFFLSFLFGFRERVKMIDDCVYV